MNRHSIARWIQVFSLLGLASFILCGPPSASAQEGIDDLWSPTDIRKFREAFIENFKRTGLSTTPEDAAFLRVTVESSNAQRGIEVGSFTGFGAIHMGMGFERTGGHLITIEIDSDIAQQCRENIRKVGLDKTVTVVEGDALKVIPELEGKFDFMFIDAVKKDYFKYFNAARFLLKPGAVIVADNVIQSADAMRDFLDAMKTDPDYDMVIIQCSEEKSDGMAVIYKVR
ncbi:MAG: class I SAM-dependent methyltransferase [bacterium]